MSQSVTFLYITRYQNFTQYPSQALIVFPGLSINYIITMAVCRSFQGIMQELVGYYSGDVISHL